MENFRQVVQPVLHIYKQEMINVPLKCTSVHPKHTLEEDQRTAMRLREIFERSYERKAAQKKTEMAKKDT